MIGLAPPSGIGLNWVFCNLRNSLSGDRDGRVLELGNLASWVELVGREQVSGRLVKRKRQKDRSLAHRLTYLNPRRAN